jgi:hypothetical protein
MDQNNNPLPQKVEQSRRDYMATMAEMSFHIANVTHHKQEEVALFMVEQHKGHNVQLNPFNPNQET